MNAAVEAPQRVCTIKGLGLDGAMEIGKIFNIVAVAEGTDAQQNCSADVEWGLGVGEFELGDIKLEGSFATLSARCLVVGMLQVIVGTNSDSKRLSGWTQCRAPVSSGELVNKCSGLRPEVTWSEEQRGRMETASTCDGAIFVELQLVKGNGNVVFLGQRAFNLRGLMQGEAFTYRALHICIRGQCGDVTEGVVPALPPANSSGSGVAAPPSVPANSSGSGVAAPVDAASLPTVPVDFLAEVVAPSPGSAEVSLPPTKVAVDPAVVILVCDRDCVADVAERAGVDVTGVGDDGFIADALVELRIDGGDWGYALGGFLPVDNGLVSAEFRVTPINGEPVFFAADFYGNDAPLRETVSVNSSGDVLDSSGQTIAQIPMVEVVAEESGTPVLLIMLILLALLVAVLVAASVMKNQRAKLAKSMDTSDTSSSV